MEENKNDIQKETQNGNNNDSLVAMIFGILAVVIMALAAHFMG